MVSNKKKKKKKKKVELKNEEDRKGEILEIIMKLRDLGLSKEMNGIKEFTDICREYIKDGLGRSGKIKLNGLKRVLCYNLTTRKEIKVQINLKYNKDV
jgi:hypothetical protein